MPAGEGMRIMSESGSTMVIFLSSVSYTHRTRFFNMSAITTGSPKMAVTALMESSTGENSVSAIKSLSLIHI